MGIGVPLALSDAGANGDMEKMIELAVEDGPTGGAHKLYQDD